MNINDVEVDETLTFNWAGNNVIQWNSEFGALVFERNQ